MKRPTHHRANSLSTTTVPMAKNGAADLRIKKSHGVHMVRVSANHNLRAKHCPYARASNAFHHGSPDAEVLHGSADPMDVSAAALTRRQEADVKKLRKNQVVALEVVVSLRPRACAEEGDFFRRALEWTAGELGGWPNVLSAVIHHDEGAPHMHVLIIPVIGGKMVGSAMVGGPGQLRGLRDRFQREVCSHHGLSMAAGRLRGVHKLNATAAVLSRIEADDDPVKNSAVWAAVEDLIRSDPRPFLHDLGIDQEQFRPPPRPRSMAQIFTSKGKGPQHRRAGDTQ